MKKSVADATLKDIKTAHNRNLKMPLIGAGGTAYVGNAHFFSIHCPPDIDHIGKYHGNKQCDPGHDLQGVHTA